MWITRLVLMCAAFIIAMPQAKAAVLYDNGPADPTKQIWRIHDRFGYDLAIADSFTLTEDAVLTGVELTLYVYHDITPISLDWAITSTPNTYPIQATAHLALTNIDTVTGYLTASFAVPDIALGAGTYYLALQNALTTPTSYPDVFWGISNGPSADYSSFYGGDVRDNGEVGMGSNSSAFRILGSTPFPNLQAGRR